MLNSDVLVMYPNEAQIQVSPSYTAGDFRACGADEPNCVRASRAYTSNGKVIDYGPWIMSVYLIDVLEYINQFFGGRVLINSGYRSPYFNNSIRGSRTSGHMSGSAIDCHMPGIDNADLAGLAMAIGVPSIGYAAGPGSNYTGFVELNLIGNRMWSYHRRSNGSLGGSRSIPDDERQSLNRKRDQYLPYVQGKALPRYVERYIAESAPHLVDVYGGGQPITTPSYPQPGPVDPPTPTSQPPTKDTEGEKKNPWPWIVGLGAIGAVALLWGGDN